MLLPRAPRRRPPAARDRAGRRQGGPAGSTRARSSRAVVAVGAAQVQLRGTQRADRRTDARQRRAQVVRHGAKQRGLDQIAAPEHLRLHRLSLQLLTLDGDREQRRESRKEPVADVDARVRAGRRVDRPDVSPRDLERIRDAGAVIPPARRPARSRPTRLRAPRLRGPRSPRASSSSFWPASSSAARSARSADSCSRCSAAAARRRARAASSLTTTAVAR